MRCDLTWLTSRYTCIFGQGCHGIYADSPDTGCCTLGAHFADKDDEKRVAAYVDQLDAEQWQFHPGRPDGKVKRKDWVEKDEDGERKTRTHRGRRPARLRLPQPRRLPDSAPAAPCTDWRSSRAATRSRPSRTCAGSCRSGVPSARSSGRTGTSYTEVTISEYDRRGWGPGGHDLDWYCSGNTEAHVAVEPVYVTNEPELVELMGRAAYDELVRHCEAHLRSRSALALHPADPR